MPMCDIHGEPLEWSSLIEIVFIESGIAFELFVDLNWGWEVGVPEAIHEPGTIGIIHNRETLLGAGEIVCLHSRSARLKQW